MAPVIIEVPIDHERYKSGQSTSEFPWCSVKRLMHTPSRVTVPKEMAAQRQLP